MPVPSKLTSANVTYVYMMQFTPMYEDQRTRKVWNELLATKMDVSPKTIRDIWHGTTWSQITRAAQVGIGADIDADLFRWEMFPTDRPALDDPFAHDVYDV